MSEAFGRKLSVVLPMSALMIFSFASATAKDLQTLLITRFFGGVFGSAPICNGGGVLADIWPAHQRGAAMMVWGLGVIVGPLSAPTVGAALVVNLDKTGWRWTEYLTGILLAAILIPSFVFIDESYPPVLLGRKASQIRHETKNWAVRSKSQESQLTVQEVSRKYLIVPIEMLIDPICFLISLYAAFVYAVIYLAIPAFPIEFQEVRHWNAVRGSLPFFATIIGTFIAGGILLWGQKMYITRLVANNNKVVPEARLFPMMVGSFFFPAGLFIMGWTSDADIHWIGWCFGAMCLGLGFFTIFQSALTYMVDTYLMLAASALAANMFLRSVLAGTFPLFANALLHNLGLNWGMSLLGFISAAMIPIPFLFYIYGKRIRAMGKRSKMSFV
ncbi:major facilitator superfamily domain-containing protein, partial [Lophiotrema nucula]